MRKTVSRWLASVTAAAVLATTAGATGDSSEVLRWDFNVFLGDKKLGEHTFEVREQGGQKRVRSEAEFVYKVLFVPAYRYEHSNSERWSENCLLEFEAQTYDNGKKLRASGEKSDDGFEVVGEEGTAELPECVMTFAYWNPDFLRQDRLLNPQTGKYLDVEVEQLSEDSYEVNGEKIPAQAWRIVADGMELKVWYSAEDRRWLGLESVTEDDKVLRYVPA